LHERASMLRCTVRLLIPYGYQCTSLHNKDKDFYGPKNTFPQPVMVDTIASTINATVGSKQRILLRSNRKRCCRLKQWMLLQTEQRTRFNTVSFVIVKKMTDMWRNLISLQCSTDNSIRIKFLSFLWSLNLVMISWIGMAPVTTK
jgi:hypothetical protein